MKGKKALGMLEWIMILALVVMVAIAVIVFFTRGINPLGLIIGKPNVATLVTMCQTACSPDSVAQGAAKYDFCERPRDLIWEDINKKVHKKTITCDILKTGGMIQPNKEDVQVPLPSVEIDCDVDCTALTKNCQELGGIWSLTTCDLDNENDKTTDALDKADNPSKYCCVLETCQGTSVECPELSKQDNCEEQVGCKWENDKCDFGPSGVANCLNFENKEECNKQDGCSWA